MSEPTIPPTESPEVGGNRPDAAWKPVFPADKARAADDELTAAVACDGRDHHTLTMPPAQSAAIGLTGVAVLSLDVYLHAYGGGTLAAALGLILTPVFVELFARWVDGPTLYYRSWGRLHRLPLTSVTAVSAAAPQKGNTGVLLTAPELAKPLRVSLRNPSYLMTEAARDHLRGWLSAPQVHWTPEARALLDDRAGGATPARHRALVTAVTVVLPLIVVAAGIWLGYQHRSAPPIAGAPGYQTFGGSHGKPLPEGRPWGRACQPIRFAAESSISDSDYAQIAGVVRQARRDGIDVTLESRSFRWSPTSLYYVDGHSPADTERLDINVSDGDPPRLPSGQLEHIGFNWNTRLDPDGSHEDLTFAYGELWTKTTRDPVVLRRSIRQLIAFTQGIIRTTKSDSGIASDSTIDGFTPSDVAAMKDMSGCP